MIFFNLLTATTTWKIEGGQESRIVSSEGG